MYTTEEIISSIQRIAAVPVGQPGLSNDQYIAILNREMTSAICPFIISVQEEYIIEYTDTLIGSGTEFTIPSKAIAGKLREVKIYDSSDLSIRNVPRISLNDLGNNVFGFYMLGNKVMLTNSAGLENKYLRMYFYWRPNKLALLTDCAVIQSVSGATATTTGIPGAFTNPTFYADLIKHESQFDVLY
jgi:hypothetical protein